MARSKKAAPAAKVTLAQAWTKLFTQNHKAAKKRKLTDPQLTAEMEKIFPDRKGKTTLTLVSGMRSNFNRGTDIFKKQGIPDIKSVAYDEDGNEKISKRGRPASTSQKKSAPKKAAAKKSAPKKAASKKSAATKKTAGKRTRTSTKDVPTNPRRRRSSK